ncbi:MAG: DoxX family protein [Egibacteraceae bacterium]
MTVVTWIVGGLLALAFTGAGVAKLARADQMVETLNHLGVSENLQRLIGAVELAAAAGIVLAIWVPVLGLLAAIGLVLLMIGAVIYHQRANDPPQGWAPPAVLGILAAVFVVLVL